MCVCDGGAQLEYDKIIARKILKITILLFLAKNSRFLLGRVAKLEKAYMWLIICAIPEQDFELRHLCKRLMRRGLCISRFN